MDTKSQKRNEGLKFNHLTALKHLETKNSHAYWLFKCDCGNEVIRRLQRVKKEVNISCGCIKKKRIKKDKDLKIKIIPSREEEISFLTSGLYNSYKKSSVRRGHSFEITLEHFSSLIFNDCYYCKSPPFQKLIGFSKNKGYEGILYNGVDRVVNNEGYIEGNTVTCCGYCNRAKGIYGEQAMKEYINRIKNNNNE